MVGTSSDGEVLLPGDGDLEGAVASGELQRLKVRNRWLYFGPDLSIEDVLDEAARSVTAYLSEWLLGTVPFFHGAAARLSVQPQITGKAMGVLVNQLCVEDRLGGLALLSQSYQPYIAYFAPADREEIERQMAALRELLQKYGRANWRQLPEPRRKLRRRAWRLLILAHGEFLGLGYLPSGRQEIVAW